MAGEGQRGRAKKPLAEKKQSKSYRPDRNGEPAMEVDGKPVKPRHLKGIAGDMWKKVVPDLIKSGCVGAVDAYELTAMCEWWELYRVARDRGDVMDAKRAYDQFSKVSARFGLTPVDRQKLKETTDNKKDDGLPDFLSRINIGRG